MKGPKAIYGLVYKEYLDNMWEVFVGLFEYFLFGEWINRDLRCNNSSN